VKGPEGAVATLLPGPPGWSAFSVLVEHKISGEATLEEDFLFIARETILL